MVKIAMYPISTGPLGGSPIKALILATIFAYCYIFLLPWDWIHHFPDMQNYLRRAEKIATPGYVEGIWSERHWLTSELLWKQYLLQLAPYLDDYPLAIRVSSFVALSIFFRFALTNARIGITLLLFFNPIFVDLMMGQLRAAAAFALLYLALESKTNCIKLLIVLGAISCHASSILIISVYVMLLFLAKRMPAIHMPIVAIFIASATAFSLKYIAPIIMSSLDDHRLSPTYAGDSSSILFSSFWAILALVIAADCLWRKGRCVTTSDLVAIIGPILFFLCSAIGIYGLRYMAFCIPAFCISISNLPKKQNTICLVGIAVWQSIQYYYWL